MTCRHKPGDPECSSSANYIRRQSSPTTPDKKNYEVVDVAEVKGNLVLKVKYPNCHRCAYEGTKIMVFLNVSALQAMTWKEIDPHFGNPEEKKTKHQAPYPSARFPASDEGWKDALAYAATKGQRVTRG